MKPSHISQAKFLYYDKSNDSVTRLDETRSLVLTETYYDCSN